MHVVCLISEYIYVKHGSLNILPPSPQKSNALKCGRNIFAPFDQEGVGEGVTMVSNWWLLFFSLTIADT